MSKGCRNCHDRNLLVQCACGCNAIIFAKDKNSQKRRYKIYHKPKGFNSDYPRGKDNPAWKGGRYKNNKGYWLVHRPDHPKALVNGMMLEHRIVYEEYYRCCLLPRTFIHHINEKRDDNRIENLQPIFPGKHKILHSAGKRLVDFTGRRCVICGTEKTKYRIRPSGLLCPEWYKADGGWICSRKYCRIRRDRQRACRKANLSLDGSCSAL